MLITIIILMSMINTITILMNTKNTIMLMDMVDICIIILITTNTREWYAFIGLHVLGIGWSLS